MNSLPDLLTSVYCNRCQMNLVNRYDEGNVAKYRCRCGTTKRILINCHYCQEIFLIRPYLIRKTNYCSKECYWQGTNRKQIKICQVCQKQFRIKSYLAKQGFGFYCSRKCWDDLQTTQRKVIKCKQCKKLFTVPESIYKHRPKFCSKVCKDDFERDYVTRVCLGCKQEFELPRSDINRGRGLFCTWECFKKYSGETSIEKMVRLQLQKLKEPFRQEVRFKRYIADFYLPKRKLVIECDGEYWHRSEIAKKRDARKDKFLFENGFKVLRLSEETIRKNISEVLQKELAFDKVFSR